jgi:hypothetical protein
MTADKSELPAKKAFTQFQEQKENTLFAVDDMMKYTPLGLGENLIFSLLDAGKDAVKGLRGLFRN